MRRLGKFAALTTSSTHSKVIYSDNNNSLSTKFACLKTIQVLRSPTERVQRLSSSAGCDESDIEDVSERKKKGVGSSNSRENVTSAKLAHDDGEDADVDGQATLKIVASSFASSVLRSRDVESENLEDDD